MARGPLALALCHLRKLGGRQAEAGTTDGQLLERFAWQHEETAFAALLERHGPMVLGVCRRVLDDEHAAEDAFQATFLVLVRKAGALAHQGFVAGWLYTVAHHMALRVRAQAARQRAREQEVRAMAKVEVAAGAGLEPDLRPVLDAELEGLPAKYRMPIVLCYLEGKTNDEAAQVLGWTRGTVAGRLSRARDLLRDRLARRGVTLSAGGLALALTAAAVNAAVPATLLQATTQSALLLVTDAAGVPAPLLALADGMLAAWRLAGLRWAALVLVLLGAVSAGTIFLVHHIAADPKPAPVAASATPDVVYLADLAESKLSVPGAEHFGKGGTVQGVTSPRTLALHPPTDGSSAVAYRLDKNYRTFESAAGIRDHDRGRRKTPLTFIVLGDGQVLWRSQPVHESGRIEACRVDVTGVEQLELQVHCPGPSVNAWAAWVDPRVSK
jgi:RNA polymerase sigma factor (sigma-70 family)